MKAKRPERLATGYLLGCWPGRTLRGGGAAGKSFACIRHEKLFRWLQAQFPEGRLYGPYHHGGRDYFQWMARGEFLRERLVPLVAAHIDLLDDYVAVRFRQMCERYGLPTTARRRDG
jgi:hypothetical protein